MKRLSIPQRPIHVARIPGRSERTGAPVPQTSTPLLLRISLSLLQLNRHQVGASGPERGGAGGRAQPRVWPPAARGRESGGGDVLRTAVRYRYLIDDHQRGSTLEIGRIAP